MMHLFTMSQILDLSQLEYWRERVLGLHGHVKFRLTSPTLFNLNRLLKLPNDSVTSVTCGFIAKF